MQNLFIFITHHWLLVAIFVVLAVTLIWLETQGKVSGMARLNPQQAINLINRDDAVVFDIRDKSLFDKGHIANAIHLTESALGSKKLNKYKDKPIILTCNSGTQSPKFAPKLKQQGLNKLYFLQGGLGAWTTANLPLVKK